MGSLLFHFALKGEALKGEALMDEALIGVVLARQAPAYGISPSCMLHLRPSCSFTHLPSQLGG